MKSNQSRNWIRQVATMTAAVMLMLTVLAADAASFKSFKTRPSRQRASVAAPAPTDIYLRAEAFDKTMPDGAVVRMWGFARDTSFGSLDGTVSSPGPQITVPVGNPYIVIHLDNNLPQPVSIVIPGYVAQISGELEEKIPGWRVLIGPQEASDLEGFIKTSVAT